MTLGLVDEAVTAGSRQTEACEVLGIDPRTVQRWKSQGVGDDRRAGPKTPPANKLSEAERRQVLEVVNRPEHRDLSVKQIVPRLADRGVYVASESTMYRILREEKQLQHRAASRPPTRSRTQELVATAPNQVWTWDISVPQKAAREMRDRPLAIGLQEQVANHRKRLGSKALVVSVSEKVPEGTR